MTSMNTISKPLRADGSASGGKPKKLRIALFGDSHSHAVQRAIDKRVGKGLPVPLSAYRLLKEKNGIKIGDTSFEHFQDIVRRFATEDVVLSMIGGNQHSVFSLIQHAQPFDFFTPDGRAGEDGSENIPYRALEDAFVQGLRRGDGASLEALRKATSARVVHIIPPPPKSDNAFIGQNHESRFAQDLQVRGVSSPALRLKFWNLQTRVLEDICSVIGVEVMLPPTRTVDEEGFLRPEFYARDATHANWLYGERVLREIEKRFVPQDSGKRVTA